MIEYCIKHQNKYVIEGNQVGLYNRTVDVNKASTFPTIENTISYIENDMRLNVHNVEIIKRVTSVTESVVEL